MHTTKKIKLLDFKLTKEVWSLLFWLYKSKFHWNGINFLKSREYIFWDSVKNIDWKNTWKTEKIYTKIFEEEKELKVLFLIDTNSSMLFSSWVSSKKDILQEIFYSLAFSCYKNSDSFWVLFFDWKKTDFLPYKKDFWNIEKTISFLENIENNNFIDEKRVEKIFSDLLKKNTKDNLIFVLSDYIFENDDKNLKILSLCNEIIFINVFDFMENNLEFSSEQTFFWWKTFLNIFWNRKKIAEFNSLRRKKIKNFENILKKNNIWYIYTDTKTNIFKALLSYFSKI